MASTNWKKCKTGEAKAIIRHNDTQERLLHEHDNQEIDRILTPHNVDLIPGGYAGACKRLDDRLASLDAAPGARNKRKDRVIMVSLETAVPAGIAGDRDKEDAWAAEVILPGSFLAFPGDRAELSLERMGLLGTFRVAEAENRFDGGNGALVTLTLKPLKT